MVPRMKKEEEEEEKWPQRYLYSNATLANLRSNAKVKVIGEKNEIGSVGQFTSLHFISETANASEESR